MTRTLPVRWIIFSATATFLLGGCSLFHHRDNYYSKAHETRPLEVPPDLDTPPTSDELVVPGTDAAGSTETAATASSAAQGQATPPGVSVSGEGLHVADSVDSTWQRVGTALEHADVGSISERDESAHSYTLEVEGLMAPAKSAEPPQERHWYTAIWHRIEHPLGGGHHGNQVNGKLRVTVSAEGDGSRVNVQGPPGVDASAATQRVVQALRDGLASSASQTATTGAPASAVNVEAGLHIADNVDHTWQRVGLALERAKVGTISARDEAGHSYTLDVENLRVSTVQHAEQPKEQHWYSAIVDRILYPTGHHDKPVQSEPVSGKLQIKIVADGAGSRVDVESAPGTNSSEAARRVLQVLQSRLG